MGDNSESDVRIKFGDFEIEWKWVGSIPPDIAQRLAKVLDRVPSYLDRVTEGVVDKAPPAGESSSINEGAKKTSRGGARKASVSKGLDEVIKSKWLLNRSVQEVVDKLRERFPGATTTNVGNALLRRLNKTLTRRKEGTDWLWSVIEAG